MFRKKFVSLASLLLVVILFSACGKTSQTESTTDSDTVDREAVRPQDDFYEYVNGKWLEETTIDSKEDVASIFSEIQKNVSGTLQNDFDEMISGKLEPTTPGSIQFIDFYKMLLDKEKRNKDGMAPLLPYLEKIENISTLDDLSNVIGEFTLSEIPLPIHISIMTDMNDAEKHLIAVDAPSILLSDKSYYEEGSKEGQKELKEHEKSYMKLLTAVGKTEQEAAAMVKNYLKIDRLIAETAKSTEETSDIAGQYNPYSISELNAVIKTVDLTQAMEEITGVKPETITVLNPDFAKNLHLIVNEENLPAIKDWMSIDMISQSSEFLSEEIAKAGSDEPVPDDADDYEKDFKSKSYETASDLFKDAIGMYYGKTYLGDAAKKDVIQMTENMISLYEERLKNIDWLSEKTKENALKKLDTLIVQIGYPDKLPAYYEHLTIDTDVSAFDNVQTVRKAINENQFSVYSQSPDRKAWKTPAHEVNAFYDPQANTICFPAAILQKPVYHVDHSKSQNYGGIGTVIGHELSHAFDTNGAKFDEKGNLHDWWTKEDYKEFEKRAQKVVEQFDGMEFEGGTVNGKQTVSENIADSSGISIALESLKNEENSNLEEFFTSWATMWRKKSSPEMTQQLLLIDTHSPNKLRANVQLSNLEDFYTTFDVKKGDKMYLAPEERASVW